MILQLWKETEKNRQIWSSLELEIPNECRDYVAKLWRASASLFLNEFNGKASLCPMIIWAWVIKHLLLYKSIFCLIIEP